MESPGRGRWELWQKGGQPLEELVLVGLPLGHAPLGAGQEGRGQGGALLLPGERRLTVREGAPVRGTHRTPRQGESRSARISGGRTVYPSPRSTMARMDRFSWG